jgi:catechol 2,3-dioxygenase-like lactoylglutathione lyase family enzyme
MLQRGDVGNDIAPFSFTPRGSGKSDMVKWLFFFGLLTASFAAAETPARLERTSILVNDLEQARRIYEGALGLKPVPYDTPITSERMTRLFGLEGTATIDILVLESGVGGDRIALMQIRGRKPQTAPPALALGGSVLLFTTDRLRDVHEKLKAEKVAITQAPLDLPPDRPNSLFAIDPNGVRLMVLQNVRSESFAPGPDGDK